LRGGDPVDALVDMSMDMSMPAIPIAASAVGATPLASALIEAGTGAYAGHSIKPTDNPGPNIGM
jgi:hypothetical protein